MRSLIKFFCFAVYAVSMILFEVSGVPIRGILTVIFAFVTYITANVLCELKENKKKLNTDKN